MKSIARFLNNMSGLKIFGLPAIALVWCNLCALLFASLLHKQTSQEINSDRLPHSFKGLVELLICSKH